MYHFNLKTLILGVTLCGAAFACLRLIHYGQECESLVVPVHEVENPLSPEFRHDRAVLKSPSGRVFQRPYDPLTLGVVLLFGLAVAVAVGFSEWSRGGNSRGEDEFV